MIGKQRDGDAYLMSAKTIRSTTQFNVPLMVAAAFLAATFLAGCVGPESGPAGSVDRSFTVSGPVRLELTNGSGNSRVSIGSPGEVRIHAEFRVRAWPWDDPDRMLKSIVANPPFSQEGDVIRIGRDGWEMNGYSADYSVTVPPDTQMRGASGSGNLDVNGIAGPANFTVGSGNISTAGIGNDTRAIVGSGDVTFTDTQGRIDVTSGSGRVVVRGAKGDVRARAGSGEISVEQPGAKVEADTGSGNVMVRDAAGDVRIRTASGEINVDGNPGPSSYWDCRASSGDVTLHVPSSASFRFYAHTSSGDIHASAPSLQGQSDDKHDFQARVGDGKARVEIATSSGNISLH